MLLGCLLYAFIFGQVTSIIQQLQKPNSDFHSKLDSIRRFTKLYTVPEEIGARLIDYFRTTWTTNKGLDVEEILSYFPNELQADACLQIHKSVFESMPEFKSAPLPALRNVSRFYSTLRSAPGAKVLQQGELIDFLYFVERGSLEVRKNEHIVGILGPGDVFGSNIRKPIGKMNKSLYEIHTLTYSDLHYIKLDTLVSALQLYPDFFKRFKRDLVYSFDITKKMRVYESTGKRLLLFDEEETSFSEGKSDSESFTISQDQTMVEGQTSLENLIRGRTNVLGSSNPPTHFQNDSNLDILTELNILREDVKTSIDDVHSRMQTFDVKINRVLDLLQKVTSDQSEIRKRMKEATDINQNEPVREIEENEPGPSQTEMDVVKKRESTNWGERVLETVFMAQEPSKSSQNAKMERKPSFKKRISSKDEGAMRKAKGDGSSKKGAGKESGSHKSDNRKEDASVKKEAGKEKQGSNKVGPEKETGNVASKSNQSKSTIKQPMQRQVVDDLDELEKELEEIGIP